MTFITCLVHFWVATSKHYRGICSSLHTLYLDSLILMGPGDICLCVFDNPSHLVTHGIPWQDVLTRLAAKAEQRKRQNRLNQRALRQMKQSRPCRRTAELQRFAHIALIDGELKHRVLNTPYKPRVQHPGTPPAARSKTSEGFFSQDAVTSPVQESVRLEPVLPYSSGLVLSRLEPHFECAHSIIQIGALATIRYLFARNDGQVISSQLSSLCYPLSSDHLLPLIQHNALRDLAKNNALLSETTSLIKPLPDAKPRLGHRWSLWRPRHLSPTYWLTPSSWFLTSHVLSNGETPLGLAGWICSLLLGCATISSSIKQH